MPPISPSALDLLRAIAKRSDNEHVASLTPSEVEFAMTLEGRRLLQCIRLDGVEFRLSGQARAVLADDLAARSDRQLDATSQERG